MRNLLLILLGVFFLAGCGQTLKNSWGDFRAYYNTYYNAQESFRAGLNKVQNQPVTLEPSEPVRIHHAPVKAGGSEFQEAIEKGAKVLRKFPDTKWIDDAILLIGKSYYYRHEFHPALQKFEELRTATSSSEMKQLSIIWKGRTLLDLDLNAEGISFLESELEEYPEEWSAERKAEILALAGEHHVILENWEEAADLLSDAVRDIEGELLGRTYFLYGQVLEQLNRYGDSYFAFSRVSEVFPGFEYIYWARFKQADIARKENSLDLALSIYRELSMDDKNVDRLSQLEFEIAHTLEMKGEIAEAEKRYKKLLHGNQGQNIRSLRADIYYRLGQIYSEEYNKVAVAAAYFDSSSTSSERLSRVEAAQDPKEMADTFGEYERLQSTISRADSLLRLGSLSPSQLDSALEEVKAQKRRELLAQQEAESGSQQMLANRNQTNIDSQNSISSAQYGFLNHRNSNLVNQSKTEFRAVWGNRPLVDNWRNSRALRSNVSRKQSISDNRNSSNVDEELSTVGIDLEEIPKTPEDRRELEIERVNAQYRLGSLLFLNLNSHDEAKKYLYKVVNSQTDRELRPRAMYTLYELYNSEEAANKDSVRYWESKILKEYPDSKFTRKIQDDETSIGVPEADESRQLIQQFRKIENYRQNKGDELRRLALENQDSEIAPSIHYHAIEEYIEQAKTFDEIADSYSGLIASNFEGKFTFTGAYWDSVYTVIQEFDTTYSNAEQQQKVKKLREMLQQEKSSPQIPTCKELNLTLSIAPSMDDFLSTVNYSERVREMSVSGQIIYSFVVSPTGEIKSYELVSQPTSLGIEESFERAIDQSLRFEPLKITEPPQVVECEVAFPIKL